MRSSTLFVVLCVALVVAFADTPAGQTPVFRTGVEMVTVNVAVLDSAERPVSGLAAKDFVVMEDGVEAEVELVLAPGDTPLDVAFVLDFSGSILAAAPYAQAAEIAFLQALSPDDCVLVLPFTDQVGYGRWGRPRDPALGGLIRELVPDGGTALFDAMLRGLSALTADSLTAARDTNAPCPNDRGGASGDRRRVMVVLTDGLDNRSVATHEDTLAAVRQAGVPIIAVGAGAAVSQMRMGAGFDVDMHQLEAQWREIAEVSGGKFIKGNGSRLRMDEAYGEVLGLLRASYLIGYRPPPAKAEKNPARHPEDLVWHTLKIGLRGSGLHAVAREGHYRSGVNRGTAEAAVVSASKLLQDGEPELALQTVNRAIAADPFFWWAHYYQATALSLLTRGQEALAAAERATELAPGNGRAHAHASLAAFTLADDRTAWEHAIRAQQAGADMTKAFELLGRRTPAPADLAARLAAPKVFVGDSQATDLVLQASLKRVYRTLSRTLAAAPGLALVDDPSRRAFMVTLRDERVDDRAPRQLDADLMLFEKTGRRLWKRKVKATDIDDPVALERTLTLAVAELQEQIRKGSVERR